MSTIPSLPLQSTQLSLRLSDASKLPLLIVIAATGTVFYFCAFGIYNIFLHPLAKFPGPTHAAASNLPYLIHKHNGTLLPWLARLHATHGPTVRITPTDLSFTEHRAFKDIYGHRTVGRKANYKPSDFYQTTTGVHSILSQPDDAAHAATRRIFTHAFSERALKLQEPLIAGYVDKLVAAVRDASQGGGQVNLVKMYNCTTFDIMGDLTFGESLGMLEDREYTPWVKAVFTGIRFMERLKVYQYMLGVRWLLEVGMTREMRNAKEENFRHSASRVDRRLAKGRGEADIWNLVLEKGGGIMPRGEMYENASVFMVAGTETTATLLSGLSFLLLQNPEKMAKLVAEVRALDSEHDLNLENLPRLPYLNACFEEGLRCYPPVAEGLPRRTPEGGNVIAGQFVPAGTTMWVPHKVAYGREENFKDAAQFVPERWLPGTGYDSDKRDGFQPFSTGPRNCLGKNLAYHEMRLILAKMLWHFDLRLSPESECWDSQKSWLVMQKSALLVTAHPVARVA